MSVLDSIAPIVDEIVFIIGIVSAAIALALAFVQVAKEAK